MQGRVGCRVLETTSRLGTALKADRQAISASSLQGCFLLGPLAGAAQTWASLRPWDQTEVLEFSKNVRDILRALFKLKNKNFHTVFQCRF